MSLTDFWPTEKNVLECIKPEAENPRDEVFLAIHQPMQLERRHFDNGSKSSVSEQELLKNFLTEELPTGTLLIPIIGASGIGKSHIVRWLDVQLRQRKDAGKRHVIRIPKNCSLKSVLRRILEGLEGTQYDQIKKQLLSAREKLTGIQSEELVFSHLLIAIRTRVADAKARKANAKQSGEKADPEDERWIGVGDDRKLPSLLKDPETQKLFLNSKSRRGIITELTRRLTEDSSSDELPRNRFEKTDFEIPDELQGDVSKAGEYAQKYLRTLGRSDGRALADAIELLNTIVDEAIAPLASPSDNSLSEILYDIRKELLKEDRELVLLVEDFAVLAGIQGALLGAMVHQGVTDGVQDACTLRTALAVTEGYLKDFDTVKTRSQYAWHILETPDAEESQTVARMCSFAGAYLNAARFGADALKKHLKTGATDQKWVPDFLEKNSLSDDESKQLEAFGTCENNRSLFPFNANAIREIAYSKMRDGDGNLMFKPRMIIKDMLIPVLKDHRTQYLNELFPPATALLDYGRNEIDSKLRNQVIELQRDKHLQERLFATVRFWGGNPSRLEELDIPEGIYNAFTLPAMSEGAIPVAPAVKKPPQKTEVTPSSKQVEQKPAEQPPATETPSVPPELQKRFDLFGRWAGGQDLAQNEANNLRGAILELVLSTVDWDAELLAEEHSNLVRDWVYLPQSRGASNCTVDNACIVVASDEDFAKDDLPVINLLQAVLRHRHYKGWDYDEADEDFTRLANFMDRSRPRLTQWLRSNYRGVKEDPTPAFTQTLLVGARLLNVENAHAQEDAALINAVFANSESEFETGTSLWERLRTDSKEKRPQLKTELLDRVAARQGSGDGVFAVDAATILNDIKSLKATWKVEKTLDKSSDREIASHVKTISRDLEKAATQRRSEILKEWKKVESEIGQSPDKKGLIQETRRLIELGKQHSLKPPMGSSADLGRLVDEFDKSSIATCLEHVQKIQKDESGGALLSALARFDEQALELLIRFTVQFGAYATYVIDTVDGTLATLGDDIVPTAVKEFEAQLDSIEQSIPKTAGDAK